jgi:hypothetical protein
MESTRATTDSFGASASPSSTDRIQEIARLAKLAGAPEIAAEADALAERLAGARFYVACVGQFKRGKSTLLNALVMRLTGRSPLRWLVEALQPPAKVRRTIDQEAGAYLERLVFTNASRVLSDLDERVLESRRRMEAEIRGYLRLVYESAERALERASPLGSRTSGRGHRVATVGRVARASCAIDRRGRRAGSI